MRNVNVVDYFDSQSIKGTDWYNRFYRNGKGYSGSLFRFLNTNFRNLNAFEYYFNEFKLFENIPRSEWEISASHGQEKIKQHVVNLTSTYLFISTRDSNNNLVYSSTEKGRILNRMLDEDFSTNEKKIIILLLIINGSFDDNPRGIFKLSKSISDKLTVCGYNILQILHDIKEFITTYSLNHDVASIFNSSILWILTFHEDRDFLKLFKTETEENLNLLYEKTVNDYLNNNKQNVLSWKYKGTNNSKETTLDSFLVYYITEIIQQMRNQTLGLEEFISFILESYSEIYPIDKSKVTDFILNDENRSVFSVVKRSIMSDQDDFYEYPIKDYKSSPKINEIPTQKIDDTSEHGVERLEVVRIVLKNLAKKKSQYKCELEELNMCRYFTSKEDIENYLEIHHFIPREFSYVFEDSIEFVENYVPLCPHCHRMIHKAIDRERIALINYIYNKRRKVIEDKLNNIDIEKIYKFYHINKESRQQSH